MPCPLVRGSGSIARDHHAGDSGGDQGVGAGRRAAVVRARLEADVGGGTRGVARRRQGDHLGVRQSRALVPALADDGPVAHEHAPDHRVRRRRAGAQLGQLEAAFQVPEILRAHGQMVDSMGCVDAGRRMGRAGRREAASLGLQRSERIPRFTQIADGAEQAGHVLVKDDRGVQRVPDQIRRRAAHGINHQTRLWPAASVTSSR